MDIEQAKQKANELKKQFAYELEYHRSTGNYKFEITPGDIYGAFMKGFEFGTQN